MQLAAKFAISSLLFVCGPLLAVSFVCNQASTRTEKMVCGNESLSKLDTELGDVFALVVADAPISQKSNAVAQERQWISQVRNVCGDGECLRHAYATRIKQMSTLDDRIGNQGEYVLDQGTKANQLQEFQKELAEVGINGPLTECSRMVLLTLRDGLPVTRGSLPQDVYSASCKLLGHPIMVCSNSLTGHLTVKFEGVGYGSPLVTFASENCPYGG